MVKGLQLQHAARTVGQRGRLVLMSDINGKTLNLLLAGRYGDSCDILFSRSCDVAFSAMQHKPIRLAYPIRAYCITFEDGAFYSTGKTVFGPTALRNRGHATQFATRSYIQGLLFAIKWPADAHGTNKAACDPFLPSRLRRLRFLAILRAAETNRLQVSTSPLLFTLFRRLVVRYWL